MRRRLAFPGESFAPLRRTTGALAAPAVGLPILLTLLAQAATSRAQGPLPPLPPSGAEPAPPVSPAPPPPPGQSSPATAPPPPPPPPPPVILAPPPTVVYVEPETEKRAPRYALWTGGRLGLLAYGGGIYEAVPPNGTDLQVETTGNFIRTGLGLELDIGARLDKRYIPYFGIELGLAAAGHRFDTSNTQARTSFLGIGFRYVAGDVDNVGFVSDISFGFRSFDVSNPSGSWSATGFEFLRLGFGAEIRVNHRFAVSPLVTVSGGSLTDTSGHVSFAPNQGDGQTGPAFQGNPIPGGAQTTYYAIVLGCGAHVDLFGK